MSSIKGRLEKLEATRLDSSRTINVFLIPGESEEQALARHYAQYPTTTPDPLAQVMFITWHAPDSDKGPPPDLRKALT
jgi:hypothetical protein